MDEKAAAVGKPEGHAGGVGVGDGEPRFRCRPVIRGTRAIGVVSM